MTAGRPTRAHAIVVTHTPQRLRRTLLGVACQTRTPDTIVLTCDADDDAIRDAAQQACDEFDLSITLVRRPKHELSRAGQARNNAVRVLAEEGLGDDDALLFLDGDSVLEPGGLAKHLRALERHPLVIAWRFEMTEAQTAAFDEDALRRGDLPIEPTPEQWAALRHRHRRLARQAFLRRFRLTKPHKPKLLGANFSVIAGAYARVNGHDETYEDWGQEDDDLGRRLYMAGHAPRVAVADILSFHQHHPTRAPRRLAEGRNTHRLQEPCPARCVHGLENPIPQAPIRVERLAPRAT